RHFRLKEQIGTCFLKEPAILLGRARIRGKIFVGPELQWIDKNTDNDALGRVPRLRDQANMPVVQVAHGRYQRNTQVLTPPGRYELTKRCNARELFHFRSSARAPGSCALSPPARSSSPPAAGYQPLP